MSSDQYAPSSTQSHYQLMLSLPLKLPPTPLLGLARVVSPVIHPYPNYLVLWMSWGTHFSILPRYYLPQGTRPGLPASTLTAMQNPMSIITTTAEPELHPARPPARVQGHSTTPPPQPWQAITISIHIHTHTPYITTATPHHFPHNYISISTIIPNIIQITSRH